MNNLQIFTTGLVVVSALISLVTEAVKNILIEHNKTYHANTLAGTVALIMSVAIGAAYVVMAGIAFSGQVVVGIVTFAFMSWLCAMVGYDKVIQTIAQFKNEVNDN